MRKYNRMMSSSVEISYSIVFHLWIIYRESKTENHRDLQGLFCGSTFQTELLAVSLSRGRGDKERMKFESFFFLSVKKSAYSRGKQAF